MIPSAPWYALFTFHCHFRSVLSVDYLFTLATVTVYQVVCEHLKTIDRTSDAVECFHQNDD